MGHNEKGSDTGPSHRATSESCALEIFSFKCRHDAPIHDAPIHGVIEGIIEPSGTHYFCVKDLDENKPTGSVKIRVAVIAYFLRYCREEVIGKRKAEQEI